MVDVDNYIHALERGRVLTIFMPYYWIDYSHDNTHHMSMP